MGKDLPMGVAASSNDIAKARNEVFAVNKITGIGGQMGAAYSGRGQGVAKTPQSELETPISPDVAEAIKQTAEGMAQTFITRAELNAALGGIHPAILNQNRGDQNSAGGVGPMVLTLPMVTSQGDVSAAWEPAAGGSMPFSGNVWVGGKLLTVPTTGVTQFLSVPLDGTTTCAWVAAMPASQMPSDAEIFDTAQTAGDIHLSGNFAGG